MPLDMSMSEVHCMENDGENGKQPGISGNTENGETMTTFRSISNDTQAFSVADERKPGVSLTWLPVCNAQKRETVLLCYMSALGCVKLLSTVGQRCPTALLYDLTES